LERRHPPRDRGLQDGLAAESASAQRQRLAGDHVGHDLAREFRGLPSDRMVLEITEHAHVENYGALLKAPVPLRATGVKIAIDDAGSG